MYRGTNFLARMNASVRSLWCLTLEELEMNGLSCRRSILPLRTLQMAPLTILFLGFFRLRPELVLVMIASRSCGFWTTGALGQALPKVESNGLDSGGPRVRERNNQRNGKTPVSHEMRATSDMHVMSNHTLEKDRGGTHIRNGTEERDTLTHKKSVKMGREEKIADDTSLRN